MKRFMKRKLVYLFVAAMYLLSLTACGNGTKQNTAKANGEKKDDGKLSIVATIFPEYDWTREVLGSQAENADLTMLLDSGVDLHSFQPTSEDMIKISTCDLFIYVGGESDGWVKDALADANNKDMIVIDLLETLGDNVKEEEVVEGMEEEDEHDHDHEEAGEDHDHEDHHDEEEGPEYDEHVWLSLKRAQICVNAIAEGLAKADAKNADIYRANAAAYNEKLAALDSEYQTVADGSTQKTVLFGDRFPFRYMTDDYGLTYYAAFVGCSAETEASFETITFLAGKVNELSLPAVCTIEGDNHGIADTIIKTAKNDNVKTVVFDSMQATTSKDVKEGTTYLTVMNNNLEALKNVLQ